MLSAQKHKQQCLVWVNLRIVHDRRIWREDVAEFIAERFPACTVKERGQYYKWIKAFAKGRYDEGSFEYWTEIIDGPIIITRQVFGLGKFAHYS